VLAALVTAFGTALPDVPLQSIRLVGGASGALGSAKSGELWR
jgi:hypothetical protein